MTGNHFITVTLFSVILDFFLSVVCVFPTCNAKFSTYVKNADSSLMLDSEGSQLSSFLYAIINVSLFDLIIPDVPMEE